MSDESELAELVGSARKESAEARLRPYRSVERTVDGGGLVQWIRKGDAFWPCHATCARLAAGAYRVEEDCNSPCGADLTPTEWATDALLRLPDSRSAEVIAEVERFWGLKDAYERLGFVHKRGFLLYGPAGSGKSCTVAIVVADVIDRGGVALVGSPPHLLSAMLPVLRRIEPDRPLVVVLEDIDAVVERHGEAETLALLDGESSVGNVVFIATTNYPEQLDGRVVNRPSRFDRVVKIGMPSADARRAYLEARATGLPPEEVSRWVELTGGLSIAHLKELIVCSLILGEDAGAIVKRLRDMSRVPKGDGRDPAGFGSR